MRLVHNGNDLFIESQVKKHRSNKILREKIIKTTGGNSNCLEKTKEVEYYEALRIDLSEAITMNKADHTASTLLQQRPKSAIFLL